MVTEDKLRAMLATSALTILLTGCVARMNDQSNDARIYFSHSSPAVTFGDKSTSKVNCNFGETDCRDTVGGSDSNAQLVLYFLNDKSTLEASEIERLQSFVLASIDAPSISYLITGHTDSVHTNTYNAQLSIRRAEQVLSSMIHMGIPITQLAIKAAGETAPVASNRTAEGRQLNRRVTVGTVVPRSKTDRPNRGTQAPQTCKGPLLTNSKPACSAFASGVKDK